MYRLTQKESGYHNPNRKARPEKTFKKVLKKVLTNGEGSGIIERSTRERRQAERQR